MPRLWPWLLLTFAGCSDASLSQFRPGVEGTRLRVWLTVNFRRVPKQGDVRDVKLVFKSIVLAEDAAFDWPYMVANDYVVRTVRGSMGDEEKILADDATTGEMDPPLGPMTVKCFLDGKDTIKADGSSDVVLDAELYWAGKKQDSARSGLFLAYQKK